MLDLEDICLLMIRGNNEHYNHWINNWINGYPIVQVAIIDSKYTQEQSRQLIDKVYSRLDSVFVVAHGIGCVAFADWFFYADIDAQRRIKGAILANPDRETWQDDETFCANRVKFPFPTYMISASGDSEDKTIWVRQKAQITQANHLISPNTPTLNANIGSWQWGMKLMQEILLS